ncbi:hypothetical protein Patl1_15802 [Pistacia atlantica]|uniref:Uncharacterized protein n=1 Tax=Pistacia atlantica TaxID=434234 RepID=A0ACC1B5T0_9ROSI|nr:hypothetical protein Patl1_15802 [Pistacia atlantica]
MASPTWLPQEVQPSSGGPSGGSSTAMASPCFAFGGTAIGSMHEPAQVKFANAPAYAVPSLTFSYNTGGSQEST